MTIDP